MIVVILLVVGIHSCDVSSRNSALRDYNNSVSSLMEQSAGPNGLSEQLFSELSSGNGASNPNALRQQLTKTAYQALLQLQKAQGLSVPDQMSAAQRNVVLALQMRSDGIHGIAATITQALGSSTNKDALESIAADMASFYASDVVYKVYAAKEIAEALNGVGIAVGGSSTQQIAASQFLPDIGWLTVPYIASKLHTQAPASTSGKLAPGTHGDALSSVSVAGATLSTSSTNAVTASPAPSFTLNVLNDSDNTSVSVGCTVKATAGTSTITGRSVISSISQGTTGTCTVKLPTAPPPGQYTVVADVSKVRGEHNVANNKMSFSVTFQ